MGWICFDGKNVTINEQGRDYETSKSRNTRLRCRKWVEGNAGGRNIMQVSGKLCAATALANRNQNRQNQNRNPLRYLRISI